MAPVRIDPVGPAGAAGAAPTAARRRGKGEFGTALRAEIERQSGVRLSAHAQERLRSRGIALSAEQARSLGGAVDRAAAKGAVRSLVLMDGLALIVSVPNRVVITAVEDASAREGVFTNIDSAVMARPFGPPNGR